MKYTDIIVRSAEQLKKSKKEVIAALDYELLGRGATYTERKYPLYYNYLQSSKVDMSEDNLIGEIYGLKRTNEGITATVITYDVKKLAEHFSGVIDNVVIGLRQTHDHSLFPYMECGIVYDKFAKHIIDKKKQETDPNKQLHRIKELPTVDHTNQAKDNNPLHNPKIIKELHDLAENQIGRGGGVYYE